MEQNGLLLLSIYLSIYLSMMDDDENGNDWRMLTAFATDVCVSDDDVCCCHCNFERRVEWSSHTSLLLGALCLPVAMALLVCLSCSYIYFPGR